MKAPEPQKAPTLPRAWPEDRDGQELKGGFVQGQPNGTLSLLFLMAPKNLPQTSKPEKGERAVPRPWHAGSPAWTQEASTNSPCSWCSETPGEGRSWG